MSSPGSPVGHRLQKGRIDDADRFGGHDAAHAFGRIVDVGGAHGDPAAGLGGAVALKNRRSEPLFPSPAHFHRQHVAGAVPVFDGAEVILIQPVVLQHHAIEGGNPDHGTHLKPVNGVKGGIQVDFRLNQQGPADQQGGQAARLAQNVKQGGVSQNHVFLNGNQSVRWSGSAPGPR